MIKYLQRRRIMKVIERYQLFGKLIDTLDLGVTYIEAYDAELHDYNGTILYQAEAKVIKGIGDKPGITVSELAVREDKTTSAYSQLIRKLRKKGWVRQERNDKNNREYNLFLTEEGQKIFEGHKLFEEKCYRRTFEMLDGFSEQDLNTYIKIQEKLNASFALDVEDSKEISNKWEKALDN